MNAFNAYCRRATTDDKPARDFLLDWNTDWRNPKNITSWQQLEAFLWSVGACHQAVDAAKIVWRNYQAQQRRRSTKRRNKSGEKFLETKAPGG